MVGLPLLVLLVVASAVLYFLPTVIASARHKQNTLSIFLLNLFLGWSFIGWVVALVWSVSAERV
ncbi:MAG: superinfection immunity protein [Chloroflexota bacterium]